VHFDVVVLSGNLVNTADTKQCEGFLGTVRRQLRDDGRAFIRRYDPEWASTVTEREEKGRTGHRALRD
jgi:hypothetical protein